MIMSKEMVFIWKEEWTKAIDLKERTNFKPYPYIACVNRALLPTETLIAHNYGKNTAVYIMRKV